jgi:predicted DNA-binding transcriptional regulator YafY
VLSDSLTKAGRLVELQLAFWKNPRRALTTSELARRVGVAPRTMRKYLVELSCSGRLPITREGRGWRLAEHATLEIAPVRFLLEEAVAVYLAARLLVQHADQPNPAVAGAVAKLAVGVPKEMREPLDLLAQRVHSSGQEAFARIFRTLAYGWALRQVVHVRYSPRSRPAPYECDLSTYLLEPAAIGSALYAVGHADPPGALRVLKAERILDAKLTDRSFEAPPPEGLLARLESAWGVWISEGEPVEVELRFDAEVAARVRETRWHPTQRLTRLSGGGLSMTLTVSSTTEILPWILGWGSHCEVVRPDELRIEIADELRRSAALYPRG